jgi:DegV family protein with EDD domain
MKEQNEHKIALITDSTCDIPQDLIEQYGIMVVPMYVVWGDEVFRDGVDLQPQAFYRRLDEKADHPTTSHPTPEDFLAVYEQAVRDGAEEIVAITISSGMSGAFQSAQQAAREMDIPVHVVDSKGPTMTLGWQVLAAARAREDGGDAEAMVQAADDARSSMVQFVCLDTMEYLHKGGRIGGATRFIGSLLNIKPLICINHVTGLVEAAARVRTYKRALETLYQMFFEQLDTTKDIRVAVLHGGALEEAQRLVERIRREFEPVELLLDITGPVLGVHTGPRAIALCGYTEG